MDRRHFIHRTAAMAGLAAGLVAVPTLLRANRIAPAQARWYRFDAAREHFVAIDQDPIGTKRFAQLPPARLTLEQFHPSAVGGIESLTVHAAFDHGEGEPWRFLAWHYRSGDNLGSSRASGFDLQFEGAVHLECDIDAGSLRSPCTQTLDLARTSRGEPGRHVIVFARGATASTLAFSGDWSRPLLDAEHLDYLTVRVDEQVTPADLALRADLACACEQAPSV